MYRMNWNQHLFPHTFQSNITIYKNTATSDNISWNKALIIIVKRLRNRKLIQHITYIIVGKFTWKTCKCSCLKDLTLNEIKKQDTKKPQIFMENWQSVTSYKLRVCVPFWASFVTCCCHKCICWFALKKNFTFDFFPSELWLKVHSLFI